MRDNSPLKMFKNCKETIQALEEYGYTESEIYRILIDLPNKEGLANNIRNINNYLESNGLTRTQVQALVIGNYKLYSIPAEELVVDIQKPKRRI